MNLVGKESWIFVSFIPSFAVAWITSYDTTIICEFGVPAFSGKILSFSEISPSNQANRDNFLWKEDRHWGRYTKYLEVTSLWTELRR